MLEGGLVAQATHTLGDGVVAAGELRQGKAPAADAVASFGTLFEVLRPRRSKILPRRFVLAVTEDRVAAIKSFGIGSARNENRRVFLRGGEQGSWPRGEVFIEAQGQGGADSIGGVLHVGGEAVPVFRPLIGGDEETDALFALLAR